MITAIDLTKDYGRHRVLDTVTMEVRSGVIAGLLGPNGAGKSTLLHILVGLIAPGAGDVLLDGRVADSVARARAIGFCADDLPMPELLTGLEYLDLVRGIRRLARNPGAERSLMSAMRLDESADRMIATYSHGMKRKLQVVAALLHRPRVLILDEPFRGLDPESSTILKTLLRVYAERGNAVLVSTHDLLVAEQMCTNVTVLDGGRILADDSVEALRGGGDRLETAFDRLTGIDRAATRATAAFLEGLDALGPRAGVGG